MFNIRKGLYQSPDGAPAGAAATADPAAAAAAAAGASGQPPAAGSGDTGASSGAFVWTKAGLDNDSMALVNDRQWKGVPDVLTSYRNLEKLVGVHPERIIKLPGEKDPVDAWG